MSPTKIKNRLALAIPAVVAIKAAGNVNDLSAISKRIATAQAALDAAKAQIMLRADAAAKIRSLFDNTSRTTQIEGHHAPLDHDERKLIHVFAINGVSRDALAHKFRVSPATISNHVPKGTFTRGRAAALVAL